MTTDRHLALMALMNEVEAPSRTYRHCVRRAAQTESDSPANLAAIERGNAALLDIEQAVRRWVAAHPECAADADEESATEACGKCWQPFDPTDTRFDGRGRFYLTPYCRRCVEACHSTEIADHRCVICE